MKEGIHPKWFSEAKVVCACGNSWTTGATQPEIRTDVCSACHPFYTGEQRIVDTEGQVDRFLKRLRAREEKMAVVQQQAEKANPMNTLLAELDLNARTIKALADAGVNTAGDFLNRLDDEGEDALLAIAGFGRKGLIDVKRRLREAGFNLAGAEGEE